MGRPDVYRELGFIGILASWRMVSRDAVMFVIKAGDMTSA
jgi:hypothetical protein